MNLRLDWATHEATKYACEKWHYSKCMPIGNLVKIGVWEKGKFIGVIIFSHGTAKDLGTKYGFTQFECVELTRIALTKHESPVTKMVKIALKMLKTKCPKLKLVVSFADGQQGHLGGIYKGGNWLYAGYLKTKRYYKDNRELSSRVVHQKYKTDRTFKKRCTIVEGEPKYRYLMPLTEETRIHIEKFRKPFPQRAGSKDSVATVHQTVEGGASPTPALQNSVTIEEKAELLT